MGGREEADEAEAGLWWWVREDDIALPNAARLANRETKRHLAYLAHLLLRFLFSVSSGKKATDDGDDVARVASSPAQVFAVLLH